MRCVITGGSSGIGLGLAEELAARGWSLLLLARRGDLLQKAAEDLRARGCRIAALTCDVTDRARLAECVAQGEEALGGPFDLAIANAGIAPPTHAARFKIDDAERTIRVNVLGTMYLFDAVIPGMIARRSGHFVGIASIAGLRGLATAGAYSASKAAVQAFLEASRAELRPYDVKVTIVNPGFVATAMTEKNRFRMPFLMDVGDSVNIIADGIERGDRVIEFPRPMSLMARAGRLLPGALWDRIMVPYARRRVDDSKVRR